MSPLREAVADYLLIRRALGYKLDRAERLLGQFLDYLDAAGAKTVTIDHALAWALLPERVSVKWAAARLSVVRGFAAYLVAIDPATEVPPADLLPHRGRSRLTPYLYSDADVAALLAAADTLRPPLRATTYRTLLGLLVVTGLRIGEALALDRDDLDLDEGLLLVRAGKFGKLRELPLHPTTVAALRGYLRRREQLHPGGDPAPVFICTTGRRPGYRGVLQTFRQLADSAGLEARPGTADPRLHDLRHSFAVNTVLDAYQSGDDVQTRLPLLSTYLGHVNPATTYWYLSAAPELLGLASQRLEAHLGGQP